MLREERQLEKDRKTIKAMGRESVTSSFIEAVQVQERLNNQGKIPQEGQVQGILGLW